MVFARASLRKQKFSFRIFGSSSNCFESLSFRSFAMSSKGKSSKSAPMQSPAINVAVPMDESKCMALLSNASTYLEWAKSESQITVVGDALPSDLLPAGVENIELFDIRVNPFILTANSKKRRPVPDDMIYNALADYRRLVARGNTVMRITYKDDDEKDAAKREEFRFVLQGMHKFTGKSEFDDDDTTPAEKAANGDNAEDDDEAAAAAVADELGLGSDDEVWRRYFLAPLESAGRRVIWTEKANGEAAHVAVTNVAGVNFVVLGSKNVHIALRVDSLSSDLDAYQQHSHRDRFKIAFTIAEAVIAYQRDQPDGFARMVSHLVAAPQPGLTANFELLQPNYEHVVAYHLAEPKLKFFTFTSPVLQNTLCLPIEPNLKLAGEEFKMTCVEYQAFDVAQLRDCVRGERDREDREGAVAYFEDGEQNVIGLWKLKTVWYILIRAVREKVRRDRADIIARRLSEINQWLHLTDDQFAMWSQRAQHFATWLETQKAAGTVTQEDLDLRFASTWDRCFS